MRQSPFCISKWEVWDAYKRVKANQGAAGVDEQSIADFENPAGAVAGADGDYLRAAVQVSTRQLIEDVAGAALSIGQSAGLLKGALDNSSEAGTKNAEQIGEQITRLTTQFRRLAPNSSQPGTKAQRSDPSEPACRYPHAGCSNQCRGDCLLCLGDKETGRSDGAPTAAGTDDAETTAGRRPAS